jgi:nucleotide-binding universal stress UspA family protein
MSTIRKILFPVDFSPANCGAAKYVEAMAGYFEATITMIHVAGMAEHHLAAELTPQHHPQLDAFLASEFKHLDVRRICVTGSDPAAAIAAEASRWDAHLVMMPTHGLGAFRRLLLGSVTAKVLNDVTCPVWTSVHAEGAPRLEDIHCRRILCALDLENRSAQVLDWAAWLAEQYQAELGIVHATACVRTLFPAGHQDDFARILSEKAEKKIEVLRTKSGHAARVREIYVRSGSPSGVVFGAARDFAADLVVIGRHNGSGVSGYIQQNAYAILRSSPCPVVSI